MAKHLRSQTHVENLEKVQKVPLGTLQMMKEELIKLDNIDTTDCDRALAHLIAMVDSANTLASFGAMAEQLVPESLDKQS